MRYFYLTLFVVVIRLVKPANSSAYLIISDFGYLSVVNDEMVFIDRRFELDWDIKAAGKDSYRFASTPVKQTNKGLEEFKRDMYLSYEPLEMLIKYPLAISQV
jgi:hypothetical protein